MRDKELPNSFMFRGPRTADEISRIMHAAITNPEIGVSRIHIDGEFGVITPLKPFPLSQETTPEQLVEVRAALQAERCIIIARREPTSLPNNPHNPF